MVRAVGSFLVAVVMLLAAGEARAEDETSTTGWALGAGIGGLAAGAVTISLGIVAAENLNGGGAEHPLAAGMALGAAAVTAAAAPVVYLGGLSARQASPGVEGSPVLRGLGWIFYGVQLLALVAVGAMAAGGEQVDGWLAGVGGALGAVSLNAFAIDAMLSWSQARSPESGEP